MIEVWHVPDWSDTEGGPTGNELFVARTTVFGRCDENQLCRCIGVSETAFDAVTFAHRAAEALQRRGCKGVLVVLDEIGDTIGSPIRLTESMELVV